MVKKIKCPICGNMNEKDTTVEYSKKFYCDNECVDEAKKEAAKKTIASKDWSELYEYIVELYKEKPTGMMFKQLADYRKSPYDYTDKGMYLTLKYFYETLGNSVDNSKGLGIIPYVYDDAKKNFITRKDISTYNNNFKLSEIKKLIKVKDSFNGHKKIRGRLINFDEIDDIDDKEEHNGNETIKGGINE